MILSSNHRCSLLLVLVMAVCYAIPLRADDLLEGETPSVTQITQDTAGEAQEWPMLPGETLRGLAEQMYPRNLNAQRRFIEAVFKANRVTLRGYAEDTLFTQPTLIHLPRPESIKISSGTSTESYSRTHSLDPAKRTDDDSDNVIVHASRQATPGVDKDVRDWLVLPGESLKSLAAQIYPKDARMQKRFISAAQALNAEVYKDTAPDATFTHPLAIRLPELRALSSHARSEERTAVDAPRTIRPKLKATEDGESFRVKIGRESSAAAAETTAAVNLNAASGAVRSPSDESAKSEAGNTAADQPGIKTANGARLPPLRLARQLSAKSGSAGFHLILSAEPLDLKHAGISEAERSHILAAKREIMDYDDLTARNLALKEEQERLDRRFDHLRADLEQLQQQGAVAKTEAPAETPKKHPKVRVVEKSWFGGMPRFSIANLGLFLMVMLGIALPVWLYRRYKAQAELHETVPITQSHQPSMGAEVAAGEKGDESQASGHAVSSGTEAKEAIPNTLLSQSLDFDSDMGIQVEAVDSVVEEARMLVTLGHSEQAIKMLNEHILASPEASPQPWLYLLEIYRAGNKQQEFSELAKRFHLAFNVITPTWDRALVNMVVPLSLEEFPHIIKRLSSLWGTQEAKTFLTSLIHDNRSGERIGFSLEVLKDILLLLAILDMRDFFRADITFDGRHGQLYDYPHRNS